MATSTFPPGGKRFSGDIAFYQIYSGNSAWASMYGSGGKLYPVVGDATGRRAAKGDKVCMGGNSTEHRCNHTVTGTNKNIQFSTKIWGRNLVQTYRRHGPCTYYGDSGGPVYTVMNKTGIVAKGILSGGEHGPNDTRKPDRCKTYFSDIAEARWLLRGGFPLHKRK